MNATSIDPVVQTVIVGASVHALGAVAALTLYSITRRDRYLLFWGLAGAALCLRWGIHYWGETDAHARFAEMIAASLGLSFILIGALDLLPNRKISLAHAGCVLAAVFSAAIVVSIWTDMPYTVFYTILPVLSMLAVWCLWKSYRHTRQLGLGVAALLSRPDRLRGGQPAIVGNRGAQHDRRPPVQPAGDFQLHFRGLPAQPAPPGGGRAHPAPDRGHRAHPPHHLQGAQR